MRRYISKIEQKILPILQEYEVTKAGLFGSCSRGEMEEDSDIDILVEIKKDISLLGFIELKQKIEEALDKKVDLVEYSTLKPLLKDRILKEQTMLIRKEISECILKISLTP